LIYVRYEEDALKMWVPAEVLKVGDYLIAQDGSSTKILSLKTVQRKGAYSPLTTSGSLLVSGVVAPNYVS